MGIPRPATGMDGGHDAESEGWLPTDVHAFYYAWYGNEETDGAYSHWNHVRIKHWDPKIAASHSQAAHVPPDDIGGWSRSSAHPT